MHLPRRTIRRLAAAASAGMALIYYLIGLEVLEVARPGSADVDVFAFGMMAGSAFLLGAALLVAFDRRVLWILGALLQVFVVIGYVAVASERTPAFEVWGMTLRLVQLPLFAALVYLALRPPSARPAAREAQHRRR